MSSKADRDNRSNQLNPNNSAYSSSRGPSVGYDDDDSEYPRAPTTSFADEAWQRQADEFNRKMAHPDPVETEFHFDFVTLQGRVYAHRVTVRITNPSRSLHSVQEVLRECFHRVWQALRIEEKAPLAFGRASTPDGVWLEELGFEYRPGAPRATKSGTTQVPAQDGLWFNTARVKVEEAKRRILGGVSIQRVDIGVVDETMM